MEIFWLIIVILISVLIKICYRVTREFCFKEFKKLESHTWRCQERVTETSSVWNNLSKDNLRNSLVSLNTTNCNVDKRNNNFDPQEMKGKIVRQIVRCYCGRELTTLRGLNVHKRSCHVFNVSEMSDLITETVEENNYESDVETDIEALP